MVARLPDGPARLRATITSVRWPTTSRPRWIHDRLASSSRSPALSVTAVARPATRSAGSSTTTLISARRPSAARRPRRSPMRVNVLGRAGRSMTSRSTVRPASRAPAIDRLSSRSAGVRTTSHSGRTPRVTASTGSSAAARSSQATIAPLAWASAASRRASVVRPLEGSPRKAANVPRGIPAGPRMASSATKPVEWTRPISRSTGRLTGAASAQGDSAGSAAMARAPTTSVAGRGAAAPQRSRRLARAALTAGAGVVMAPE